MRADNPIVDYWFEEAAKPASETQQRTDVYSVILEVGLDVGVDVLAAFAGGRARFLSHTGDISMWEGGDGPAARLIAETLEHAKTIAQTVAEPHSGRLTAPEDGTIRISVFTGAGVHRAHGPIDGFNDHPVFNAAVDMMNELEGEN
ncbi:MAG: hypothetical protein FJW32_14495 [Acidobacteria bacterium]|nr:hypothetical protein [Acidobacteriota bacterium]